MDKPAVMALDGALRVMRNCLIGKGPPICPFRPRRRPSLSQDQSDLGARFQVRLDESSRSSTLCLKTGHLPLLSREPQTYRHERHSDYNYKIDH